jgi:hypothetical protein
MRPFTPLIVLALATRVAAGGQELPLSPGQRVRVTAPSLGFAAVGARFVTQSNDTLLLRRGSSVVHLPVASVTQLEVPGRLRIDGMRVLRFSAGGAVVGAVTGALVGWGYADAWGDEDWPAYPEFYIGAGAVAGIGCGLLVGALVGSVVGLERGWVPISTNDVRVGLAPPPSGHTGLGLSVSF